MFSSIIVGSVALASIFPCTIASPFRPKVGSGELLKLTTLFEFSKPVSGSNLVQARDGSILATTQGSPDVWRIDGSEGQRIATFAGHQNTFGIVELGENIFYVNAANYTHAPDWKGVPGSNTVYRLNLDHNVTAPVVSSVVTISEALTCDGMAVLSQELGLILMADTQTGELFSVDTRQNTYSSIFQSELWTMTATSSAELAHVGINGFEIQDDVLYYTNTARHSFGSVSLAKDGVPDSPIEVLLPHLPLPDDFAVDGSTVLLSELQHGFFKYDLARPASEQQDPPLVARLPGANGAKFGRRDVGDYCTFYALYNRGIINETGAGLVKADLHHKGLRRGC